ncbi:MAG: DUF4157 domain-containing protein [Rivularia sp. (in: cyanobacteria)]
MRERITVRRKKNNTNPVSIPSLKQPMRGFGLESSSNSSGNTSDVKLNRKPLSYDMSQVSFRPQAKLTINQPGDAYEQEADKVAREVVGTINQPSIQQNIQREEIPEEEEENLQMKPLDTNILQREEIPEEEEENLQMKSMVQRQSSQEMTATPDLETSIQQARGSGQTLPDNVKQPMESAFGNDFSQVNIHTDTQSHQLNESIQARAFTTGNDIFFREGAFNPTSQDGQELIAHELTHVVQQGGANTKKQS